MSKYFNNIFAQFLTYGVRAISDFTIIFLIAKFSTINNVGIYSFSIAFSLVARLFLDLGFGMYLIREISKNKKIVNKYIINTILFLLTITPFLFLLSYFIAFLTITENIKSNAMLICLIGMCFMSISATFQSSFHAFQKMGLQTVVVFIQEGSFVLSSFVILFFYF